MPIKQILAEQSYWTYEVIEQSTHLGEVIREDALTSVNLAMISIQAKREALDLSITSMQGAKLEEEYGADWAWNYNNYRYLAQAKKLDAIRRLNLMSYTIDIKQLIKLANAARLINYTPIYVFYNSMLEIDNDERKYQLGCTWVNAFDIGRMLEEKNQLNQQTATISFDSIKDQFKPWHELFPENQNSTSLFGQSTQSTTTQNNLGFSNNPTRANSFFNQ